MILDIEFYRYIAAIGMLGMLKLKGKTTFMRPFAFSVLTTPSCVLYPTAWMGWCSQLRPATPEDCGMLYAESGSFYPS